MTKKQTAIAVRQEDTIVPIYEGEVVEPTSIVPTREKSWKARELAVRGEDHIQQLIMQLSVEQAERADYYMSELARIDGAAFTRGVQSITDATRNNGQRTIEQQGYLDQHRKRSVDTLGQHLDAVRKYAAANIVQEVNRSLYVHEKEERESLLKRILG